MKKAYVILKKGFEYNDEINSPSDGGHPDLIVFSNGDAIKIIDELNSKEFKSVSLSDYAYDMDEILTVEFDEYQKFNEELVSKYGPIQASNRWESVENRLHPMANEEETNKYVKMISFSFYEAVETDIDLSSFRNEKLNNVLG